jgi:hypothetical protein
LIGIPVYSPTWPLLLVDIERASCAVEGKGGHPTEPGKPGGFLRWLKTLLYPALGVQLVEALLFGPDQGVKRYSSHRTFLLSALFPTTLPFLPTPGSIPKRRLTGKEYPDRT